MSRARIRAAMETRLSSITPVWPTAWENVRFEPTPGQSWQRAKLLLADTAPLGMGANPGEEWQGVFHIGLWGPAGAGPAMVEARAELIRSAFPHGSTLMSDAVSVTCFMPRDGPVLDTDPNWFGLPVLVPFVCHVL